MTRDRCEIFRQFTAVDEAYKAGDLEALRQALGDPPDFPNCLQPFELAVGDYPLEYAIYWTPLSFIETLLALGADPNYPDPAGFPSLIAALTSGRRDSHEVLGLLLHKGADLGQRGLNDWTPLHCAVYQRDLGALKLMLDHGADPALKTRIDDITTALEDAEAIGFAEAVELLRAASSRTKADTTNPRSP
jgi:ankyrin repeat protein